MDISRKWARGLRLYKKRKFREKLENEDLFKNKSRKEHFLYAMAIGFKNNVRLPFESRDGLFRTTDLRPEDESLIKALALISTDNNFEILSNKDEMYTIAEEYAHGGIRIIIDKIESTPFGSYELHCEKDLFDTFNALNIE